MPARDVPGMDTIRRGLLRRPVRQTDISSRRRRRTYSEAATFRSKRMMTMEANHILAAIAIGIGATLVMDLWNLLLRGAFNIVSLNYCLLGRWLCHMPEGRFRHTSITAAPQKPFECPVGWIAHYTIGVMLAVAFVVMAPGEWLAQPTLPPALLYGIALAYGKRDTRCVLRYPWLIILFWGAIGGWIAWLIAAGRPLPGLAA